MDSYKRAIDAQQRRANALRVLGMIGKEQRTSREGVGKLDAVTVDAQIYYQETDGEKNYHKSDELNDALSQAAKEMWGELSRRAKEILRENEMSALIAAEEEVQSMMDQIADAKRRAA
jgi:hypothetical protein